MRRFITAIATAALVAGTALAHDGAADGGDGDAVPKVRGVPRRPTYHAHVERILRKHCNTCHHAGDIAPMALDSYADAALWSARSLEEIAAGRMPPWQPTRGVGKLAGERGLSDREWATLAAWDAAGRPEGRAPRRPRKTEYPDGWSLGREPDAVFSYGEPYVVAGSGDDVYRCFPIRTDFGRDVFVQAGDIRPGDRRVVHHVVLYIDPEGESLDLDAADPGPGYTSFGGPGTARFDDFGAGDGASLSGTPASLVLGGWAPGNRPHFLPRGSGVRIPAGATIVMQVHYHPYAGEDVPDESSFGLYLSDAQQNEDVYLLPVLNQEFTIPAGDPAYVVTAELDPRALVRQATGLDIAISGEILSVLPHMHLLGREIAVDLALPDGTEQRLVEIDDWDFEWQDSYHFERPVAAPVGSVVRLRCVFDNSAGNPRNPHDPPQDVSWGDRTVDEMALAFLAVKLRFPDEVLDLMALLGRDLPHARGLPEIRGDAPPVVRRVREDAARDRLVVDVSRFRGGGRLEIDGVPVAGSSSLGGSPRRLVIDLADALGDAPQGTHVSVVVRRADGRASPPYDHVR